MYVSNADYRGIKRKNGVDPNHLLTPSFYYLQQNAAFEKNQIWNTKIKHFCVN